MYKGFGGCDMKYDEFREMRSRAWNEKFNYLCIDLAEIKKDGKYRIFNESKNTNKECICESEPF